MLKLNSELRAEARESLKGKWAIGVVISLIYTISYSIFPFFLFIASILVYGLAVAYLHSFRGGELEINKMFDGFRNYINVFVLMFLLYLYIFLWSLLLIVPGIVKFYSYSMAPYLLYDNPTLDADAVIRKSMTMMKGHKMKLFLLDLSFIGWGLLSILTFGIGFLWLIPYIQSSRAAFYDDLLKQ